MEPRNGSNQFCFVHPPLPGTYIPYNSVRSSSGCIHDNTFFVDFTYLVPFFKPRTVKFPIRSAGYSFICGGPSMFVSSIPRHLYGHKLRLLLVSISEKY